MNNLNLKFKREEFIRRRRFTGPNDTIITSKYMTSERYVKYVFIPESDTHRAAIASKTFKTKSMAKLWNPVYGGQSFDNNECAYKEFNRLEKI